MISFQLIKPFNFVISEGLLQHRDSDRKGVSNIKRRFSIREINKTVKR